MITKVVILDLYTNSTLSGIGMYLESWHGA